MAGPGPEPTAAPQEGAGGAAGISGAQILQQIEQLLTQLSQSEPDPQVQQAIQGIQQQVEPLQQMVGKNDQAEMQSGLANPSGEAGGEPEGAAGGGAPESGGGGEGATHSVEIHIRPTSFKGANKAAMATHGERGHFDRGTPKGESPSTPRTKARAKG